MGQTANVVTSRTTQCVLVFRDILDHHLRADQNAWSVRNVLRLVLAWTKNARIPVWVLAAWTPDAKWSIIRRSAVVFLDRLEILSRAATILRVRNFQLTIRLHNKFVRLSQCRSYSPKFYINYVHLIFLCSLTRRQRHRRSVQSIAMRSECSMPEREWLSILFLSSNLYRNPAVLSSGVSHKSRLSIEQSLRKFQMHGSLCRVLCRKCQVFGSQSCCYLLMSSRLYRKSFRPMCRTGS